MNQKLFENRPLVPQLFHVLRNAIVRLELKPGQNISEKEIAAKMGVSRQPVREAFIKLADARLLNIQPQRGTFVVKISIRAVMEARFIREALETAVVRALVGRASTQFFDKMANIMKQQEAISESDDWGAFLKWDDRYHRAFTEAAGLECAWRIIEAEKAQMDRVRYLSYSGHTPMSNIVHQHHQILQAIEKGDAADADACLRHHFTEIAASLSGIAKAHGELFDDTDISDLKTIIPT